MLLLRCGLLISLKLRISRSLCLNVNTLKVHVHVASALPPVHQLICCLERRELRLQVLLQSLGEHGLAPALGVETRAGELCTQLSELEQVDALEQILELLLVVLKLVNPCCSLGRHAMRWCLLSSRQIVHGVLVLSVQRPFCSRQIVHGVLVRSVESQRLR